MNAWLGPIGLPWRASNALWILLWSWWKLCGTNRLSFGGRRGRLTTQDQKVRKELGTG